MAWATALDVVSTEALLSIDLPTTSGAIFFLLRMLVTSVLS